jgi:membrane fusion protein (multidrug efflux system)
MRLIEKIYGRFDNLLLEASSIGHEIDRTDTQAPLAVSLKTVMSDDLKERNVLNSEDSPMLPIFGSDPTRGCEPGRDRRSARWVGGASIVVLASGLAACQDQQPASSSHTAGTPPVVSVVVAEPKAVTLIKELLGRITPMRIAEVRPRVSGIIVERTFEQGSLVQEGSILYRIDPKPFEVELASAKAALARAEATLSQAGRQEDRLRQLLSGQTTTQAQYDLA